MFSKTDGFRHDSIGAGINAIEQLGKRNGYQVVATEDGSALQAAVSLNIELAQAQVNVSATLS